MSTILDSLKKSSNSRGDQEKASIDNFSFSGKNNPKKSNAAVFIVLMLLTAILLYLGYQFLYLDPDNNDSLSNDMGASTQQGIENEQNDFVSEETPVVNKSINKLEKPNNTEVKQALKEQTAKQTPKVAQDQGNAQIQPKDETPVNNRFTDLNKPLKNNPVNKSEAQEQSQPIEIIPHKNGTAQQSRQTYKLAYQLPFAIRKDLPELILNIHVYDPNPQNRIAIINGEKFEVDSLINDEVLVKEIVLEGVLLEFKNKTFLLPKL